MERPTILRTESVAIESVTPHPMNARRGNIQRLESSLRQFGQYAPVMVQEGTGHILKGNNTWRVLRDKLGASHILAQFVTCTDETARLILAVDNRTSDGSDYDQKALLALLEVLAEDDMLIASGYDQDDVDALVYQFESELPDEMETDLLGETAEDSPPPVLAHSADAVPAGPTLADRGREYDESPTRMIMMNFTVPQYTYVMNHVDEMARAWDLAGPADVLLRLIELETEVDSPTPD